MRRWILGGVLALSVLTSGCVYRANYYRHGSDYRYRGGYDYGYRHDNRRGCGYAYGQRRHHWQRGGYWRRDYGGYYVSDYNRYRLRQPPRGYRWVRTSDGDYLMVAIATGIIASVILNNNGY